MIAVYSCVNSVAPYIHWWLATDARFGPQAYSLWNPVDDTDHKCIGPVATEDRGGNRYQERVYDAHQRTHQNMENFDAVDGVIDFLAPFKQFESEYDHVVWSNYFGSVKHSDQRIAADKLIIVKSTLEDLIFNYVSSYAFVVLSEESIEEHSRVWYEDHTIVEDEYVSSWKEIWYRDYQEQCLQDYRDGKLKYMWQLNFAHWDLWDAIMDGKDSFKLSYDDERLFSKFTAEDLDFQNDLIERNKHNCLVVDIDWYKNPRQILDYLGVENSQQLTDSLKYYKDKYESNRKKFNDLFGHLL